MDVTTQEPSPGGPVRIYETAANKSGPLPGVRKGPVLLWPLVLLIIAVLVILAVVLWRARGAGH